MIVVSPRNTKYHHKHVVMICRPAITFLKGGGGGGGGLTVKAVAMESWQNSILAFLAQLAIIAHAGSL